MKILDNKCPNCRAELELSNDKKTLKCSYCNSSYNVENDTNDNNNVYNIKNLFITNINEDIKNDMNDVFSNQNNPSIIFDPNSIKTNKEEKKEIKKIVKKKKEDNYFAYLLFILGLIILFIAIFSIIIKCPLIISIHYIITSILLLTSFSLISRKKEIGKYLSVVTSVLMILMILEKDYISVMMGVIIFVTSFIYIIKKGKFV